MFECFADRADAGNQLAAALHAYAARDDVVVLALPRGGVPVAYPVARALHAPLDVLVVRKLACRTSPNSRWARSRRAARFICSIR